MGETKSRKAEILNIVFSVLLFGGLWGIVEATLGSFLHMPFIHHTMFLSSTTILVPIAYFFMGGCYKKTGRFRAVFYMGALAVSIKALSCAIFGMSFNPCFYILMEATAMGVALLVIRPKKVISFEGLGTLILANTLYLAGSTFLRVNPSSVTVAQFMENIETYVLKFNCVAILYSFAAGAIVYGVMKLAEHYAWNMSKIKKVIYHPAFASSMAVVSLVVTIVLH